MAKINTNALNDLAASLEEFPTNVKEEIKDETLDYVSEKIGAKYEEIVNTSSRVSNELIELASSAEKIEDSIASSANDLESVETPPVLLKASTNMVINTLSTVYSNPNDVKAYEGFKKDLSVLGKEAREDLKDSIFNNPSYMPDEEREKYLKESHDVYLANIAVNALSLTEGLVWSGFTAFKEGADSVLRFLGIDDKVDINPNSVHYWFRDNVWAAPAVQSVANKVPNFEETTRAYKYIGSLGCDYSIYLSRGGFGGGRDTSDSKSSSSNSNKGSNSSSNKSIGSSSSSSSNSSNKSSNSSSNKPTGSSSSSSSNSSNKGSNSSGNKPAGSSSSSNKNENQTTTSSNEQTSSNNGSSLSNSNLEDVKQTVDVVGNTNNISDGVSNNNSNRLASIMGSINSNMNENSQSSTSDNMEVLDLTFKLSNNNYEFNESILVEIANKYNYNGDEFIYLHRNFVPFELDSIYYDIYFDYFMQINNNNVTDAITQMNTLFNIDINNEIVQARIVKKLINYGMSENDAKQVIELLLV